ncbi:hypothetical protein CHS0354_039979 [Potamilus streckersoni]|uniref:Uncharacterized protein n=1 Tax=Potamilus streckersoni TaxID=2493646 RepID=A0AAE0S042_9BIVA|nr:hypothetical protein CHS0354_039979 [Potamilus streckersoni]
MPLTKITTTQHCPVEKVTTALELPGFGGRVRGLFHKPQLKRMITSLKPTKVLLREGGRVEEEVENLQGIDRGKEDEGVTEFPHFNDN